MKQRSRSGRHSSLVPGPRRSRCRRAPAAATAFGAGSICRGLSAGATRLTAQVWCAVSTRRRQGCEQRGSKTPEDALGAGKPRAIVRNRDRHPIGVGTGRECDLARARHGFSQRVAGVAEAKSFGGTDPRSSRTPHPPLTIMGRAEPPRTMKCRLAPDPSLTPTLSQRARERTRCANFIVAACLYGAQGRNRTTDTRIFSPLLYQLSYLGEGLVVAAGARRKAAY